MEDLIDELIKDHKNILAILNKIRKLKIFTKEGFDLLKKSHSMLISHLEKEDKFLYPVLYEHAKKNKRLNNLLKIFADDMEKITLKIKFFFDKHDKLTDDISLSVDFGELYSKLSNRIRKEESFLYPEYIKITKDL